MGANILRVDMGKGGMRCFSQSNLPTDPVNGTTYTFSIYVRCRTDHRTLHLGVDLIEDPNHTFCPINEWQRLMYTFTTRSTHNMLYVYGWQDNDIIDFAAPQLEMMQYATAFTSRNRIDSSIKYPISIFTPYKGSVSFNIESINPEHRSCIVYIADTGEEFRINFDSNIDMKQSGYKNIYATFTDNGTTFIIGPGKIRYNTMENVTVTWNSELNSACIYINGVCVSKKHAPISFTFPSFTTASEIDIGTHDGFINSTINHLLFCNRDLTEQEAAQIYFANNLFYYSNEDVII
jgi:hypothetical protein